MQNSIEPQFKRSEWMDLTKSLRLTTNDLHLMENSIKISDLLDETKCAAYLDRLSIILKSPSRLVSTSQFSKRYAFSLIGIFLYTMMCNKGLNVSINNCHVASSDHDNNWVPYIRLDDLQIIVPENGKRDEWRDEMIRRLFATHLSPLWRTMSKVSTIPILILWENTATRVFSLYEKKFITGGNAYKAIRLQEDYEYLIRKAPAILFGEKKNPLDRFYRTSSGNNEPVRIRKTCCFYYELTTSKGYCKICPKIDRPCNN